MYEYYRVGAAVPDVRVADVTYNKNKIIEKIYEAEKQGVRLLTFPELCLTGYTCADLFMQQALLNAARSALADITAISSKLDMVIVLGSPILIDYQLYNAAVVLYQGTIHGIHVKTFIPNYNEFYEKRWFSSAAELDVSEVSSRDILDGGQPEYYIPIGNDIIYKAGGLCFGVEICEDVWAPLTPSTWEAMAGAELIVNLSASNDTIGKRDYRRRLIQNRSMSLMCEYLYVSAGCGESSTDLIFSGHSLVVENGRVIKENDRIADNDYLLVTDIDLGRIRADRVKGKTFKDAARIYGAGVDIRQVMLPESCDMESDGSCYAVNPYPFIPSDKGRRQKRCRDIFDMQVGGLAKRLSVTGSKMVIGVSGGMDSTLALLVGAQTLKKMGRPMTELVGITMPAFGTTNRTYTNALKLMETLGISVETIPIKEACTLHYRDIGHDIEEKDITYENVQARERTQVLMDYANKIGGIVVGTGDLSELALGWCTYNADQMSMYGVNASIPKTLVKWLIDSVIEYDMFPDSSDVLRDIIDTPISPELLPPDENGNIVQKTEETVGPYELHDFFLYYVMRFGYAPSKIYFMAQRAFAGIYDRETILKWMKMFYRRFFSQQFKRSCMPDGVKVGSVCLSPRGDWRMPSDASVALWLKELDNIS